MWYAFITSCSSVAIKQICCAESITNLEDYLRSSIDAAITESSEAYPQSFDDILFVEGPEWIDSEPDFPEPYSEIINRFSDDFTMATAEIPEHIVVYLAESDEYKGCPAHLHIMMTQQETESVPEELYNQIKPILVARKTCRILGARSLKNN